MTDAPHIGTCLCQKVKIEIPYSAHKIGACHCNTCRKWCGGGPMLGIHVGPDLNATGQDFIATFASSSWAERGFCKNCGTHLFYKLKENGHYIYAAGIFDPTPFELVEEIFFDKKPHYYEGLSQKTKKKTAADIMQ